MKFTIEELETLSAKGSFLKERFAGKTLPIACSEKEKRFNLWKRKAGGSGGETAFLKRLYAEDIAVEQAKEIAKSVIWNRRYELPVWASSVNDMLSLLPVEEAELKEKLLFRVDHYLDTVKEQNTSDAGNEILLSLLPFISYAENKLVQRLGKKMEIFSKAAQSDMSEILAIGLYQMVYKTIFERLRIFILRKESFEFLLNLKEEDSLKYMILLKKDLISGGWKEIFLEYPVLARLMTIVINNWIDNMALFATHLSDDMRQIEKELNERKKLRKVNSLKGSISDSHNKGKGVIITAFESGKKIVYKPRNLQIDVAYQKLVSALNQKGFPYEITAPKALDFGDHGWIEFIEYKELDSQDQAKEFYRRAGALFCLIYTLGGNDFHGENMIASGEHPVLIDLETIISYKMIEFRESNEEMKGTQDFIDLLQESVLGLGFLPIRLTALNDVCVDFGALTGSVPSSIPSVEGARLEVSEYKAELLEGFQKAYDFFIINREIFWNDIVKVLFSESVIRVILRPTNVYAKMLAHTLNPELLKDGFLYSIEMERFGPAYLNKVEEEKVRRLWQMFLYERDALEERDVPIFYGEVSKKNLNSGEDILYEDYFNDSVMDRIHKKLLKLSSEDKDRQLDLIRESLSIYKNDGNVSGEKLAWDRKLSDITGMDQEDLLQEVQGIYKEIIGKAIKVTDKSLQWISYQHDLIHKTSLISQATASVYDGVTGVALFTSALYHITKDPGTKENTLTLIEPFRQSLRNEEYQMPVYRMASGFGNGLGGIIKSLIMIGDYLGEESIHEDVLFLVEKITKKQILKERHRNVLCGLSGLMLGLLSCYEKFDHKYSLELAKLCAEQILKNKTNISETDFGYGSSGIVYSLAKLYSITGGDQIHEDLAYLLNLENVKYEVLIDHDIKADEKEKQCLEIDGLGMMSLELPRDLKEVKRPDLEKIIQKTIEYPMIYGDHFYCGNSGRIDFLMEASIRLDKPELLKEAKQRVCWVIGRKNAKGYYNIEGKTSAAIANPSLFQGLSGIGYLFLRCLDPQKIGRFI